MMNNKNFLSVRQYERRLSMELIKILAVSQATYHASADRMQRIDAAMRLDEGSKIAKIFVVDKGHKDGLELHVVSTEGMIYILNKNKFERNVDCFITVLVARPNQVARLYRACNAYAPNSIIQKGMKNQQAGRNVDENWLMA